MSKYPQKHVTKFDPNQIESVILADIAIGLTEAELLSLLKRPPVSDDQPIPSVSAANQKILAACKDTILVTRKEKVKEALLFSVFHHLKLHRLMGYTNLDDFAWDYFRKRHTNAHETLNYAEVIVTMAAAGVTAFPLKGQALDLLFLGLTKEGQVAVWKNALIMGAHEKDTQFMAALEESKLVDKAKLELLRRKKAISNGRPKTNTDKPTQPADKACCAILTEIARTLSRPENSELLAAIERASKGRGYTVAEFLLEAAREKLERSGEREAEVNPALSPKQERQKTALIPAIPPSQANMIGLVMPFLVR